jgi:murein DD-endopeptidase MepM/ murein hydrolase activator NlpD
MAWYLNSVIKKDLMSSTFPLRISLTYILFLFIISCKTSGPGIFGKKSLHEQYGDRLTDAGLKSTALGSSWFKMAEQSVLYPLDIKIPYKETGYFSAERPAAAGLRFNASRGQKLSIRLDRKPVTNFTIYIDLLKSSTADRGPKFLAAADTAMYSIQYEVEENSTYILRIQPELLGSGEYTISITAGPSLAYPIKAPGKNHIKSFWGAERDRGARKHEGIDLFAAFRTPVVASASGTVTRVDETPIGGKVVWLRPENKNYTLYYAHLDSQLVSAGQKVEVGDTLGLMGNTGNAQFTSPHLHFGVYTFGGAIDPFPFVNPDIIEPEKISAPTKLVGKLLRSVSVQTNIYSQPEITSLPLAKIPAHTLLRAEAAVSTWFKVTMPDGKQAFIKSNSVNETDKPLRNFDLKASTPLLDRPDSLAAKKTSISSGETVDILGNFNDYYFISTRNKVTGWIMKES